MRPRDNKQNNLNNHVYSFLLFMFSGLRYQVEFECIERSLLSIVCLCIVTCAIMPCAVVKEFTGSGKEKLLTWLYLTVSLPVHSISDQNR